MLKQPECVLPAEYRTEREIRNTKASSTLPLADHVSQTQYRDTSSCILIKTDPEQRNRFLLLNVYVIINQRGDTLICLFLVNNIFCLAAYIHIFIHCFTPFLNFKYFLNTSIIIPLIITYPCLWTRYKIWSSYWFVLILKSLNRNNLFMKMSRIFFPNPIFL